MKTFDYIFYHRGCYDGFTSAWVARTFNASAVFLPIAYDEAFPVDLSHLAGRAILFVDFCPQDNDMLDALVKACDLVVIIDHHKTAMARLVDSLNVIAFNVGDALSYDFAIDVHRKLPPDGRMPVAAFDMKKCGAHMTWDFFFNGVEVPLFIRYIEDYDLWKWTKPEALPDSEVISAFIQSHAFNYGTWSELYTQFESEAGVETAVVAGRRVLEYENKMVGTITAQARPEVLIVPGHGSVPVMAVASPVLQSKVGNDLAMIAESGIGLVRNVVSPELTKVSLRSIPSVDITPILTAFGGGGHAQAGGYVERS